MCVCFFLHDDFLLAYPTSLGHGEISSGTVAVFISPRKKKQLFVLVLVFPS